MQSIAVPKFWAANPFPVLSSLLRAMIRFGQLTIIDARGRIRDFGDHRTFDIPLKSHGPAPRPCRSIFPTKNRPNETRPGARHGGRLEFRVPCGDLKNPASIPERNIK